METNNSENKPIEPASDLNTQIFYHCTKANLKQGDLISPGYNSKYGKQKQVSYVYLTTTEAVED